MSVFDAVVARLKELPDERQQEVLDFIEFLQEKESQRRQPSQGPRRPGDQAPEPSPAQEVIEADYWGVLGSEDVE